MRSNYKKIGSFIRLVDKRNTGLTVTNLLGLTITKEFIPSVANIIGTDMKNYKIIRKNQFACSTMQVRRDRKMPVALLQDFNEAIISPAYPVFEVIDDRVLLPDYLMMWFSRPEFDREALFYAVGGVRGSLEWEDFLNMTLPVPHIDRQKEIVAEYNTIQHRIDLNNQLIQKLEEIAQAIYKHWFVDFEFPNENGEPYKSAGGEMVESELGEIPNGWEVKPFTKIVRLSGGGTPDTNIEKYWNGNIPFFTPVDVSKSYYSVCTEKQITEIGYKNSNTKIYPKNTVFVTARGTVGTISIIGCKMAMNQSCYAITDVNRKGICYIHQLSLDVVSRLKKEAIGAVFDALVTKDFEGQSAIEPNTRVLEEYEKKITSIYNLILNLEYSQQSLIKMGGLLLSKLATSRN